MSDTQDVEDMYTGEIHEKMLRIEELEECLREMVRVLESKEMLSMFTMAYVHGCEYKGPTIDMLRVKKLLGME